MKENFAISLFVFFTIKTSSLKGMFTKKKKRMDGQLRNKKNSKKREREVSKDIYIYRRVALV